MELKLLFIRTDEELFIGPEYIVKDSVTFKEELINSLKSASNIVTLQLLGTLSEIQKIIAEEENIKATLINEEETLFTGYLSNNWSWSVSKSGVKAVNITIEDVGTKLLEKEFISSGAHFFNCTLDTLVKEIAKRAGITISPSCPVVEYNVLNTVEGGTTCKEILSEAVYEAGYVYYFDSFGRLSLQSIDVSVKDDLVINGDVIIDGVSVKKSIREYKSARVSYKAIESISNLLIYRNTTGQDSTHPFCNMIIPAKSIFDGVSIYSIAEEKNNQTTRIQAVNAEGNSIVSSGKIIAVSNLETSFVADSAFVKCEVSLVGGSYIKIRLINESEVAHQVTRLDVYAKAEYEKETEVIRTASEMPQSDGCNVLAQELKWIHSYGLAKKFVNLVSQYYKNASSKYTFKLSLKLPLGIAIKLTDDIFSGLKVNVLLTKRTYYFDKRIVSYEGVGLSDFKLDKEVIEERIYNMLHPIRGPAGKDGEDSIQVVIISSNGMIFRSNDKSFVTTLEARVFQGGEDKTSLITGEHFRWRRASSDEEEDRKWNNLHYPLTGNKLELTLSDIKGRCSFFAEYIE